MAGAARIPATVRATRTTAATVTTAEVASSSPASRWRTKTGTSVAESTPPSRSS
jgi:hypothetical protein